jgi:hypothetical protein
MKKKKYFFSGGNKGELRERLTAVSPQRASRYWLLDTRCSINKKGM